MNVIVDSVDLVVWPIHGEDMVAGDQGHHTAASMIATEFTEVHFPVPLVCYVATAIATLVLMNVV